MQNSGNRYKINMPTIRQQIMALLTQRDYGAGELSQIVGIREKEVCDHLLYVARSVASQRQRLKVTPARCLQCGYVFRDRKRLNKPSRCFRCKSERLTEPRYRVV